MAAPRVGAAVSTRTGHHHQAMAAVAGRHTASDTAMTSLRFKWVLPEGDGAAVVPPCLRDVACTQSPRPAEPGLDLHQGRRRGGA
jgi:hypothetical protein